MRRIWAFVAVAAVVGAALLTGWFGLAQAAGAKAPGPPIVSAVALEWRTTYEADTFERDRLRDSTTVVTRVLLVREDCTVEKKRIR